MRILAYCGVSLISKAIRWQTRSIYSHIAVEFDGGAVYEAWHRGGVRKLESHRHGHESGTRIDVFDILPSHDATAARVFLEAQLGKAYDFASVLRFLTRRKAAEDGKWFCSELALVAAKKAGVVLLNIDPWAASPRDVALSPLLKRVATRVV